MKKGCKFCTKNINLNKDKYVLLGTYLGKNTIEKSYFHWQCFKGYWEKKVRTQAENIVKMMANKVLPMAKKIVGGIIKS